MTTPFIKRRPTRLVRTIVAAAPILAVVGLLTCGCGSSSTHADPASSSGRQAVSPVVVLVHGFSPGPEGYNCLDDSWHGVETAFRKWDPNIKLVTVGFIRGDHNCDMTIGKGGPWTPIEDIGKALADEVYKRFSARGIPVVLVGHSMGGLVVQSALAQAGSNGGPPFLLVPRAVTISSPHRGTDALKRCGYIECREMAYRSAFLRHLEPDPQGRGGTVWTLFGSAHDPLVTPASSMGMPAAHRYLYEQPGYGHNGIIRDVSNATDARWQEITAGSPVVQSGVPHSLRAIFLVTTTGSTGG